MQKRIKLNSYSGFKVGDKFVISGPPMYWDSALNENCPINRGLTYPYYGTIKEISESDRCISMTDGKYGWSLDSLIQGYKISTLRVERRNKLNKLNNLNYGTSK